MSRGLNMRNTFGLDTEMLNPLVFATQEDDWYIVNAEDLPHLAEGIGPPVWMWDGETLHEARPLQVWLKFLYGDLQEVTPFPFGEVKGGAGSGNFGHSGRTGHVGGSGGGGGKGKVNI